MSPTRRSWLLNGIATVILAGVVSWLFTLVFSHLKEQWDWSKIVRYREILWRGWLMTVVISLGGIIGSTIVGSILLAGQRSGLVVVKFFCRLLLEIVRDTPLLVQLLIGYFLIFAPLSSESLSTWMEKALGADLVGRGWNDKMLIGIVLLSLFEGAYLGEILRGGVESIPKGQLEAARAVGFSRIQIWRFVIIPQALRRVLPAIAGLMVSLIKDSSLLSVIGVQEFAYQAKVYTSKTYGGIEAYLPLAVGYLVLTVPVAWFSLWLEKKFRYEM